MVNRGIFAFAVLTASFGSAQADVVVSVTGSGPTGFYAVVNQQQLLGVEWQTTQAYQDVTIEVPLYCTNCTSQDPPVQVDAYLSSTIGPSTTASQVIASSSTPLPYDATAACPFLALNGPPSSCEWITVFSGLDLAPGQYFLTLNAQGIPGFTYASWLQSPTATVETAPGVTTDSLMYSAFTTTLPFTTSSVPDYLFPPDSTFVTSSGKGFEFQVVSGAPEPSALLLLAIPALFFIIKKRARTLGDRG